MFANDLRRSIALDALRAGVPRLHPSIGVQHEDRVVLYGLHKQLQLLLTVVQRFLFFERLESLYQHGYFLRTSFAAGKRLIALLRHNRGMFLANSQEGFTVIVFGKAIHRISAAQ